MSSFDQADGEPGQTSDDTARAVPGWYPVDAATMRYWDGYEWTNDTAPLQPPVNAGPAAAPPGPAAPGPGAVPYGIRLPVSESDRTYAMVMHLGGMFFSFVVPLLMWVVKKDESEFINHHGKQILNFHFTIWIAVVVSFVLLLVLIGFFLLLLTGLAALVFTIVGAVAAYRGEYYKYPAIQFLS